MIIAGKYKVPDKCPDSCKLRSDTFYQGCACTRCPVFCCTGEVLLIEPEDMRKDWALEWQQFFNTGKIPRLKL